MWYQELAFGYEHIAVRTDADVETDEGTVGSSSEAAPAEVCVKAWAYDAATGALAFLGARDDLTKTCLTVCNATAAYNGAAGYCPTASA